MIDPDLIRRDNEHKYPNVPIGELRLPVRLARRLRERDEFLARTDGEVSPTSCLVAIGIVIALPVAAITALYLVPVFLVLVGALCATPILMAASFAWPRARPVRWTAAWRSTLLVMLVPILVLVAITVGLEALVSPTGMIATNLLLPLEHSLDWLTTHSALLRATEYDPSEYALVTLAHSLPIRIGAHIVMLAPGVALAAWLVRRRLTRPTDRAIAWGMASALALLVIVVGWVVTDRIGFHVYSMLMKFAAS